MTLTMFAILVSCDVGPDESKVSMKSKIDFMTPELAEFGISKLMQEFETYPSVFSDASLIMKDRSIFIEIFEVVDDPSLRAKELRMLLNGFIKSFNSEYSEVLQNSDSLSLQERQNNLPICNFAYPFMTDRWPLDVSP